jgi:DNA-directed RNA polymerase specialized sigma24 family protein
MRHVREVLRLKFVGGVPTREIARRIGVAASTVRRAAEGVWLRVIRRGWPKI